MTEQSNTTILLIDDHPMLRNGVKQLINSAPDLYVIGEAGNGVAGIELAEQFEPDIILLDINIQDMNGLEILEQLRLRNITSRIIMFTVSDDKHDIIAALKLGADGYLLKDMEPEDLLASLMQAADGKIIMNEGISQIILDNLRNKETTKTHDLSLLTPREYEIFNLIVQGLPNKLIARKLSIVDSTVKVHVKSILKKLNFRSRVEIAVWYLQEKSFNHKLNKQ